MKTKISILLILFLQFYSLLAAAGNEHGNGGGAMVCRDQNNKIVSAELLDLFESRSIGLTFPEIAKSPEIYIQSGLHRISMNNPFLGARVRKALKDNQKIVIEVPEGIAVAPPVDAHPWLYKEGCALEGVAQYRKLPDGERIFLNTRILKTMSNLDQAALWLHEAIYRVLRETDGDQDSIRTRHYVSLALRNESLIKQVPSQNHVISCFAGQNAENEILSFSMMIFNEDQNLSVWLNRQNNQWAFPALIAAPEPSATVTFSKLLPYVSEGVGSLAEWNILSDEVVTTFATGFEFEPKALTLRLAKNDYIQFAPVYRFQLFLSMPLKTICTPN